MILSIFGMIYLFFLCVFFLELRIYIGIKMSFYESLFKGFGKDFGGCLFLLLL